MKVSLFEQVPYRYMPEGFENQHNSVVTAPYQVVEPARMTESLFSAYAELMAGARAGFDGICVTEHSQSSYDISPNPTLLASAVACAARAEQLDVAITVLGRSLGKTREPLKIAEEYALLDCVSGGRLIAGFPVGLSYDANLNASLPAVETRERYREHRELILKAWSEPRPFPWNGRFEKYGQVNIWPRPVQQPHPPIWIPGTGSPGTLRDILQRDYVFVYLSWDGPKLTGRQVFDRYWELADELGRDRNPYRLAFLQVVAVSETDERAEREYARHLEAHYRSGLGAIPHTAMAVPGYAEPAAIEGMLRSTGPAGMLSRMKTATYAEIVDSQVAIVGSPATVADQIEAFVREFRIGNLLVMLQNGSMPRDLTEKNISLFAGEVLPRLRPVWDAEGWENHWWPRRGDRGCSVMAGAVRDETVEVWDSRLRLHVKIAGDGPPLLFFHPLSGLAWSPLLDRLAERHTVYAPEHPGTSPGDPQAIREVQTYWELLLSYEELVSKLGLEHPVGLGQSFGGMVAADLAASFPPLFSSLVLLSPLGLWLDDAPIPLMEMVSGLPSDVPKYLYAHPDSEAARAAQAIPSDPAQQAKAIAQATWNVGCTTKFAWPIADHGLGRRLHRVQVPTLIVWGREDALVPVGYAKEFGRRIAGSRVEVLDDCGHVVQADQPERSWTAISRFLAS